ncbi:hypothetical protein Adt_33108 [Abeliophyllum distichum]|uniref:Uncharacterized protein n=1 Tax=Abeliophyllum distichum TaxID=126358 RepID=A0ABD1QWK8_9LAMI
MSSNNDDSHNQSGLPTYYLNTMTRSIKDLLLLFLCRPLPVNSRISRCYMVGVCRRQRPKKAESGALEDEKFTKSEKCPTDHQLDDERSSSINVASAVRCKIRKKYLGVL